MGRQRWVAIAVIAIIAVVVVFGVRLTRVEGPAVTASALQGDWVEPIPGMEGEVQGFSLREDGVAESIGMATLQYRHWRLEGNTLVLDGVSIGNRTTSEFEESLRIASFNGQHLEVVDTEGGQRLYIRR